MEYVTISKQDYENFIKGFDEHPEVLKLYDINKKSEGIIELKIKRIEEVACELLMKNIDNEFKPFIESLANFEELVIRDVRKDIENGNLQEEENIFKYYNFINKLMYQVGIIINSRSGSYIEKQHKQEIETYKTKILELQKENAELKKRKWWQL